MPTDADYLRMALRLARKGSGATSPNPMVGALLVKRGRIIGRGWHRRAGEPHAEIEAIRDAQAHGHSPQGATLYVTLEPCCTHGRTPPCTDAIVAAGIGRVVIGAIDPNPRHSGRGFNILKQAGIHLSQGVLAAECSRLNEAFNHWIVQRTPLVTLKAAMSLDGKIATALGQSKWITAEPARVYAMRLRTEADAVLVGINTILADDPSLTIRGTRKPSQNHSLRRIILDSAARTPLTAKVVTDEHPELTTIIVGNTAPHSRVKALERKVRVFVAPFAPRATATSSKDISRKSFLDLCWVLKALGAQDVTSLLVEGGGQVNASFLMAGLAQRVAFFYAPIILGGRNSVPALAGAGAANLNQAFHLSQLQWRRLGPDLLLRARVVPPTPIESRAARIRAFH
jgi:diaminohydroxyphosphoribosylaminopyrimidine deaminase / 5-amino-6-(5-phosphoribosylamino)uracil reductase